MVAKRLALVFAFTLACTRTMGTTAFAESGTPPSDLLLWPKGPVLVPDSDPVSVPVSVEEDLQSELWKDIPTLPPEPVPPAIPPGPTAYQEWLVREPKFFLGFGMLADQLGRFATQPSGATSFSSSAYFALLASVVLEVPPFWKVAVWLLDTPIRKTDPDGGAGSSFLIVGGRALRVFRLVEGWTVEPLLGLGLMQYQVSGSGGTVRLNNGNGFTTFGFPSDSSTAHLFFLEAGAAFKIWRFRFENSLIATGLATSRRSFSFLTTLQFGAF